jgi:large subunit ribosomal protein L24
MYKKLNVKKDDQVLVISGKDKGKKGKVLLVMPKEGKVIVEGISMATKHKKPKGKGQNGGIIKQECPIYSNKVMFICPKCGKPAKTGKKILDDGNKVRYCKKCLETLSE